TVLNVNRSPVTNSLLSVLDSPERDAVLGAGGETVKRVPCEMMRLDDFLQKHPDRRFQLLKTDAQGLDLRVLHGAERALCDSIRAVIAEFHFFSVVYQGDTTYLEMMDEYLARLGFRLTAIPGISPNLATGRAFSADGLWIRP
ncbi:MAG TPA: FkbM family methyltransferase, partial [Anaerolineae bacterium]|nr:FkbM family methyltransferase [Anaerolineae bacterium]